MKFQHKFSTGATWSFDIDDEWYFEEAVGQALFNFQWLRENEDKFPGSEVDAWFKEVMKTSRKILPKDPYL